MTREQVERSKEEPEMGGKRVPGRGNSRCKVSRDQAWPTHKVEKSGEPEAGWARWRGNAVGPRDGRGQMMQSGRVTQDAPQRRGPEETGHKGRRKLTELEKRALHPKQQEHEPRPHMRMHAQGRTQRPESPGARTSKARHETGKAVAIK